jgi:hypothetical protein
MYTFIEKYDFIISLFIAMIIIGNIFFYLYIDLPFNDKTKKIN